MNTSANTIFTSNARTISPGVLLPSPTGTSLGMVRNLQVPNNPPETARGASASPSAVQITPSNRRFSIAVATPPSDGKVNKTATSIAKATQLAPNPLHRMGMTTILHPRGPSGSPETGMSIAAVAKPSPLSIAKRLTSIQASRVVSIVSGSAQKRPMRPEPQVSKRRAEPVIGGADVFATSDGDYSSGSVANHSSGGRHRTLVDHTRCELEVTPRRPVPSRSTAAVHSGARHARTVSNRNVETRTTLQPNEPVDTGVDTDTSMATQHSCNRSRHARSDGHSSTPWTASARPPSSARYTSGSGVRPDQPPVTAQHIQLASPSAAVPRLNIGKVTESLMPLSSELLRAERGLARGNNAATGLPRPTVAVSSPIGTPSAESLPSASSVGGSSFVSSPRSTPNDKEPVYFRISSPSPLKSKRKPVLDSCDESSTEQASFRHDPTSNIRSGEESYLPSLTKECFSSGVQRSVPESVASGDPTSPGLSSSSKKSTPTLAVVAETGIPENPRDPKAGPHPSLSTDLETEGKRQCSNHSSKFQTCASSQTPRPRPVEEHLKALQAPTATVVGPFGANNVPEESKEPSTPRHEVDVFVCPLHAHSTSCGHLNTTDTDDLSESVRGDIEVFLNPVCHGRGETDTNYMNLTTAHLSTTTDEDVGSDITSERLHASDWRVTRGSEDEKDSMAFANGQLSAGDTARTEPSVSWLSRLPSMPPLWERMTSSCRGGSSLAVESFSRFALDSARRSAAVARPVLAVINEHSSRLMILSLVTQTALVLLLMIAHCKTANTVGEIDKNVRNLENDVSDILRVLRMLEQTDPAAVWSSPYYNGQTPSSGYFRTTTTGIETQESDAAVGEGPTPSQAPQSDNNQSNGFWVFRTNGWPWRRIKTKRQYKASSRPTPLSHVFFLVTKIIVPGLHLILSLALWLVMRVFTVVVLVPLACWGIVTMLIRFGSNRIPVIREVAKRLENLRLVLNYMTASYGRTPRSSPQGEK